MRIRNRLSVVYRILATLMVALYVVPYSYADPLPEEVRRADARLEKHVSVESSRVLVGDLLKQWSEQTGVHIIADDKAAAQPLCVVLNDVPLGDAMDALYSLLSYKQAVWDWKPSLGKDGKQAYTLTQPAAARRFGPLMRGAIQASFEDELATMAHILSLPSGERDAQLKNNKDLPESVKLPGVQAGLAAFLAAFPLEKRLSILRGEEVTLSLADAPTSLRDFADARAQKVQSYNPNSEPPNYTHIAFAVENPFGDLIPSLWISLGSKEGNSLGFKGTSYLGGAELAGKWDDKFNDLWMLHGDNTEGKIAPDSRLVPLTAEQSRTLYAKRWNGLHYLSRAVPVSLMAHLPDNQLNAGSVTPPETNEPLSGYLFSQHMVHKWRGSFLLLANHRWIMEDDYESLPPWQMIVHLRAAEAATPDMPLPFADVVHVVGGLSPLQMKHLLRDFPQFFECVPRRTLLEPLDKSPALLRGILSENGVSVARLNGFMPSSATATRVRLKVSAIEPTTEARPAHYTVTIETKEAGRWKPGIAFDVNARPSPNAHQPSSSVRIDVP